MKTIFLSLIISSIALTGFAQVKTNKLQVSGECGSCKKKIEAAAKKAGASYALWNIDSKELTVKYDSRSSNTAKIEQSIARAGYDTPDFKATDAAYSKLDKCCQYQRSTATTTAKSCCDSQKCADAACFKDGKCAPDQSCCKDSGCAQKDCCKKTNN